METKVQIPFQKLLSAVKTLTPGQKKRLRQELADERTGKIDKSTFMEILLGGPVYSDEEIKTIEENRKSISKWRTKS